MRFLQKYEICLLFSTPSIDWPPFSKVIYVPHSQRPIYIDPRSSKSIKPPIDRTAEVCLKGKQNINIALLKVWTLSMDEKYLF